MTTSNSRALCIALSAAFWLTLAFTFATPIELGDVWWHLATGKWIAANHALPLPDPFSVTTVNTWGVFVLKGFWLSQLLIYFMYALLGYAGLVVLKSASFLVMFYAMYRAMRLYGTDRLTAYALLVPVAFVATYYDETRPQTLSYAFFACTVLMLEKLRRANAQDDLSALRLNATLLCAMMLVWANMHPGFIIGTALVGYYFTFDLLSRHGQWGRARTLYLGGLALAVLVGAINPNLLDAAVHLKGMLTTTLMGAASIHEHKGLAEFARTTGQADIWVAVGLMSAGLVFVLYMIARSRAGGRAFYALLFVGFAAGALVTYRAGLFFAMLCAVLAAKVLSERGWALPEGRWPKGAAVAVLVLLCAFVLYPRSTFKQGYFFNSILPSKASAYLKQSGPPGNLFHPYEWGGYLLWDIYPKYKSFIDGRAIGAMGLQQQIENAEGSWQEQLDKYGVNAVLEWSVHPYRKAAPPLVVELAASDGWAAVHWDSSSLVFVRTQYAQNALRKSTVWELLTTSLLMEVERSPNDARPLASLAQIYMKMHQPGNARAAAQRALSLEPGNRQAQFILTVLGQ